MIKRRNLLLDADRKKKGEGTLKSSLAQKATSRRLVKDHQINRRPNSNVRLPPSKLNLFKKFGEVTKI